MIQDGSDRWMRFAVNSSLRTGGDQVLKQLESSSAFASSSSGKTALAEIRKMIAIQKKSGNLNNQPVESTESRPQSDEQRKVKAKLVSSYLPTLAIKGNATRGKTLFTKSCSACHRVAGVGKAIGPNLAAMRNRGAETILVNILDPNREVNPQYISYHITTKDDEHHTGMIISETATSMTLMRGDGTSLTLLLIQIESIRKSNLSFMPEGFEKALKPRDISDLISFLMNE